MPTDKAARAKILWFIAVGAQTIVTILKIVERDYLHAASAAFLGLSFLMLAMNFTGDGPERPLWRKVVFFILVAASIGLLVYRVAAGRLVT